MTAVPLTPPKMQFFDNNGNPLAGGQIGTYTATGGTFAVKKATYTDSTAGTQNENPVILDSAGRANIWINGSYDFKVMDSTGTTLYTVENYTAFTALPEANSSFFETFSGDGSTTAFTTSQDLGVDENAIQVWVNNAKRQYVTNGSFATDTDWTKGSGWTISGGAANATTASSALSQTAPFTVVQYQVYTLSYTITASAGSVVPSIGGTSGTSRSSSGTYTETIICGSNQTIAFTGTGFSGTVDNVSITVANPKGFDILSPSEYTINGTALTLVSPPASDTNNIYVNAPSLLVGAASSAAAAAETSAANALASEEAAAAYAAMLTGTSATSVTIGTGSQTFTTQSNKFFEVGLWLLIVSDANQSNYMHGQVTSYSGTTLVVDVTNTGGSGTHTDWTILLSGSQGATGETGSIADANYIIAGTVAGITLQNNSEGDVLNVGSSGGTNSTFYGTLSMNSHKITDVTDPTSAQDAATKAYVDSAISTAIAAITPATAAAWISFNGITGGVYNSYNVSVSKVSTGQYNTTTSVTFTGTDYVILGMTNSTNPSGIVELDNSSLFTSTQARIVTKNGVTNSFADFEYVFLAFFGNLA